MHMSRLEPYLGAATMLCIGVFAVILANVFVIPAPDIAVVENASPEIPVLPNLTVPEIRIPDLVFGSTTTAAAVSTATTTIATTTIAATTTDKKSQKPVSPAKVAKAPPPVATSTVPVSAPVTTPAPAPLPSSGSSSLDSVASTLRNALVNIICYAPAGGTLRSISGSGVIVDPKGIILTNAHIGQYFLLNDGDVDCTIRTGGPAVPAYKAALMYISPSWIQANPNVLTQASPSGTGEFDYAFLAITKSATATALPGDFPFIPLAESPVPTGTPIVIGSYGAQFLDSSQIQSALYPTIVFGSIKDVFTFALNSIDVLALGGSAAAQEGSSGGGVVDASGRLVGTITTSTVEGATDTRNLVAISASYIRSQYAHEMDSTLNDLLSESTSFSVADFAPQIPQLRSIVTAQLK